MKNVVLADEQIVSFGDRPLIIGLSQKIILQGHKTQHGIFIDRYTITYDDFLLVYITDYGREVDV